MKVIEFKKKENHICSSIYVPQLRQNPATMNKYKFDLFVDYYPSEIFVELCVQSHQTITQFFRKNSQSVSGNNFGLERIPSAVLY